MSWACAHGNPACVNGWIGDDAGEQRCACAGTAAAAPPAADVDVSRPPLSLLEPDVRAALQTFGRELPHRITGERPDRRGRGLWICGPFSTGKTTAAEAIAEIAEQHGYSVAGADRKARRLLNDLRCGLSDARRPYEHRLGELERVDLLVLDDLHAIRATPWELEQLDHVLDSRARARRPALVTCELAPSDLEPALGHEIVTYLARTCTVLHIDPATSEEDIACAA